MKRQLSLLLVVCALAIWLPAQEAPAHAAPQKKQISIEEMFGAGAMEMRRPQFLQWAPDGSKLSYVQRGAEGDALYYYDPETGKSAVLIAADKMASMAPPPAAKGDDRARDNRARYRVAAYHWAPDSKSILFDVQGQLWVFDLAGQKATQLTNGDTPNGDPKFSPDGRYVSFISDHGIALRSVNGTEERKLTTGQSKDVLNGEVDWLYEEELAVRSNYFWSPDSRQVLFLQMDETKVPTYPIVDWIPTHPTDDPEKYPKAGDTNPSVRLGIAGLDGKILWLKLTDDEDIYIPRFGWVAPGLAWAVVLNRQQNAEWLYFFDAATGKNKLVLTEQDDQFIEMERTPEYFFFEKPGKFLWSSWRNGDMHVYLYSFDAAQPLASEARMVRELTPGNYQVEELAGVNQKAGIVYFLCNKDDPRQRQMYSVRLDGTGLTRITQAKGSHSTVMSENAEYYVDNHSSLTTAPKTTLCKMGGQCWPVYESPDWSRYENVLTPQFVDFKADDGTVLYGVLLLPPPGAPGEVNGKVPLILNPYSGPAGQEVRDAWGGAPALFDQVLAQRGFAVLKVDNRGMGGRGKPFAAASRGNLCEVELKDQLAALDQALVRFPQLDATRLGWWGWSYGGTMTAWAMTHSDRFKAGVAVAPVTDWRNYDTAYTERYMKLPRENEEGYKKTSIVRAAANLKGRLLLVHGTSDDNVHMQNTIQFINALIDAGKPFDLQLYPRKTHGIGAPQARMHLYHRILKHFEDNLMKP